MIVTLVNKLLIARDNKKTSTIRMQSEVDTDWNDYKL
jgi:hypothetical protein